MWARLYSHPEHSAFALLIWMSMTCLLSECQVLYDWDFNDVFNTDTGFDIFSDLGSEELPASSKTSSSKEIFEGPYVKNRLAFPVDRLSPEDALVLRERLKGLYALLKNNPTLMDRRLEVGSKRPQIPRHINTRHSSDTNKRSFQHLASSPVCPSRTEWVSLTVARDINDTVVEVFQPSDDSNGHQWFYTTTCNYDYARDYSSEVNDDCPKCCRGINRHRYHSRCQAKKSFVMALVRKQFETLWDWNWIQVDSSCSCSISPV